MMGIGTEVHHGTIIARSPKGNTVPKHAGCKYSGVFTVQEAFQLLSAGYIM